MDFTISASAQQYLADLNQTQAQIQQAQSQVSSGLKVQQPSDDPSAICRDPTAPDDDGAEPADPN